jgi:TPR repeat protein
MYNPAIAQAEAASLQAVPQAEQLFRLGMMCSTGQTMPLDMVSAHKWFNIAATLGMKDAIRLRNEIAGQMSDREIVTAQRAARHWLTRH